MLGGHQKSFCDACLGGWPRQPQHSKPQAVVCWAWAHYSCKSPWGPCPELWDPPSSLGQCLQGAEPAACPSLNPAAQGVKAKVGAVVSVLRLPGQGVGSGFCRRKPYGDNQGHLVRRCTRHIQGPSLREGPEGTLGVLSQTRAAQGSWAPLKATGDLEQ